MVRFWGNIGLSILIAVMLIQKGMLTILTWKNFRFTKFSTKIHRNTRLAAPDVQLSFLIQLSLTFLIQLSYRYLKSVIHQIDSKNKWLLLSVTLAAKFELVFVITL